MANKKKSRVNWLLESADNGTVLSLADNLYNLDNVEKDELQYQLMMKIELAILDRGYQVEDALSALTIRRQAKRYIFLTGTGLNDIERMNGEELLGKAKKEIVSNLTDGVYFTLLSEAILLGFADAKKIAKETANSIVESALKGEFVADTIDSMTETFKEWLRIIGISDASLDTVKEKIGEEKAANLNMALVLRKSFIEEVKGKIQS